MGKYVPVTENGKVKKIDGLDVYQWEEIKATGRSILMLKSLVNVGQLWSKATDPYGKEFYSNLSAQQRKDLIDG